MRRDARPALRFEALEARILYSADAALLLGVAGLDAQAESRVFQPAAAATAAAREIVFVDARVPDAMRLVDELLRGRGTGDAAGHGVEVVTLAADEDGMAQIGRVLAGEHGLAAVHVISHGRAGAIEIGNRQFDAAALAADGAAVAAWGDALAPDGDLLLYGCDVAAGDGGRLFVHALAALTSADVAASVNPTGSAAAGGDWRLEFATGRVGATLAQGGAVPGAWQGTLATFTVTSTTDNGTSAVTPGTLRFAVTQANALGGTDTIAFNIIGAAGAFGEYTVTLASALPNITGVVVIDGSTQPGYAGTPLIVFDGNGGAGNGLFLADGSDGSTVRALVLRDFASAGIAVQAGSDNHLIVGNFIGSFNADGSDAGSGKRNGGDGIEAFGAGLVVGGTATADRNLISGNTDVGIYLGTGANNASIQGNYIGLNAAGNAAFAATNGLHGIHIVGAASNVTVGGNAAGAGNVISGHSVNGVWASSSGLVTIQGNRIGTNAAGSADLGNGGLGILSDDSGSLQVGGLAAGAGNLVSGNDGGGIYLGHSGAATVQGNTVGLNAAGTAALGNTGVGIEVRTGVAATIGGSTAAARNVVSGNTGHGIHVGSSPTGGHVVHGNYIGTAADGVTLVGNGGAGIYVSASNAKLGGKNAGEGNTIAGNSGAGISIASGNGNLVYRNAIFSNGGLGIDLDGNGVTPNDYNDGDAGANQRNNMPVITSVVTRGSTTTIAGSIEGPAASQQIQLEFFANAAADASGYGEGQRFLGTTTVTTNAGTGDATFSVSFAGVAIGEWISAVANTETGATGASEFAFAVQAVAAANAPRGRAIWNVNDRFFQHYAEYSSTSGWSRTGSNGLNFGDDISMIAAAEAPTRDEIIFIGSGDVSGNIYAGVWNGSGWQSLVPLPLASPGTTAGRFQSFDIAYDNTNGNAMLVWDNGNTGTTGLSYMTWDGSTWSAVGTVPAPLSGEPVSMKLVASPRSHEMILTVTTSAGSNNLYAMVWDGNNWGNPVTGNNNNRQYFELNVAYEQQSGRAIAVFDASVFSTPDFGYRIWDGNAWSAGVTVNAPFGISGSAELQSLVIASDATSNRIAVAVKDINNDVWVTVWDGSGWGDKIVVTTSGVTLVDDHPTMALAFESSSGELLLAYGESGGPATHYRTWSAGGGWSAAQNGPNVSGTATPNIVKLYADPYTDTVMMGVQDSAGQLTFTAWDGSAWGARTQMDEAPNQTYREDFAYVWYRSNPVVADLAGDTLATTEGQAATPIDQGSAASVVLGDAAGWDGAMLTVSLTAGAWAGEDVLSVLHQGSGAGQVGVSGSAISFGGVSVGSFSGGTSSSALVITFNANADDASASAVLRAVAYRNVDSVAPTTVPRTVRFVVTTGGGLASDAVDTTVTVTAVNDAPVALELLAPGAPNLIANGSFETNNGANNSGNFGVGVTVAGWTASGGEGFEVWKNFNNGTSPGPATSSDGVSHLELDIGAALNGISQAVSTTAGQTYLLSFDFSNRANAPIPGSAVDVYWRGSLIGTVDQTVVGWQTYRATVVGSGGSDTLAFVETALTNDSAGSQLDNVVLNAVAAPTFTLAENTSNGTAIATARGVDADGGSDSATYSLSDSAGGRFAIDPSTGAITVADGSLLDFDTAASHSVTARATDSGGASRDRVFTVNLTNVNEAPLAVADTATAVEAGGTANGTPGSDPGGNVLTNDTDPDAGDSKTVTGVAAGSVGSASGNVASLVAGSYGSVTVAANGAFTYTVDNGNAAVQALRDSSTTLTDTFTYTMRDAAGLTSSTQLVVTIEGANDAPVLAAGGGTLAYAENGAAAAVAPALTVTDIDSATLSATVSITTGFVTGQDTLAFTDQNGIFGSWNGTTGVLTLTGPATLAQYESALRSVTYANSSDNPGTATRTVSFVVHDGGTSSNTGTRDIAVTAVNDVPVNTAPASIAASEDAPVALTGFSISDPDAGSDILHATFAAASGTLTATAGGGVTVSGSGSSVLTLRGTLADLNVYLASTARPSYQGAADANGAVALTLVTGDGQNSGTGGALTAGSLDYRFQDGTPPSSNVDLVPSTGGITGVTDNFDVNALAATLTGSTDSFGIIYTGIIDITTAGSYTFNVGADDAARLRVDGALVVNSFFNNATGSIALAAGRHAFELRYYEDVGGAALTATYSGADTGGSTTSLLASPAVGRLVSQTATSNIVIAPVNDAPVTTTTGGTLAYTENAAATAVDGGLTVTDVDSATLDSATVSITSGFATGQDMLGFTTQNGIVGSWNAGSGVLTLTGSATVAQYQAALRSVTYVNTSDNPSTATRTVSFFVNDGSANSNTGTRNISVTAVNDAPVVTTSGGTLAYTENAAATAVDSGLTVTDVDSATLGSATVSITSGFATGQDMLGFTTQNGIVGSWNAGSGVLTLTGSATVAQYQAALRSVTYVNTSDNPSTATRTVSFFVNDGSANSNTGTRNISVTAVNDAPVVTTSGGTLAYTENAAATAVDSGLTVTDVDSATLGSATVSITSGFATGQDMLAFTAPSGILGSYDPGSGVLSFTGTATVAQYQAALRSVTYVNTSDNPSTATRTVSFFVFDGSANSNTGMRNISITAVNDAPVVTTSGGTLGTTENGAATAVDSGLTVTDVDGATLDSATVSITSGFATGQDTLGFTTQNGISGIWDSNTGVLSLTGTATVAQYQAALRSVTYVNTSDNPSTATRTVSFFVNDGSANSNTGTRNISVTAVNDAPVVTTSGGTLAYTENAAATAVDSGLTVTDVDSATLGSATVSITSGFATGQDTLGFTTQNGISGIWDSNTGVLSLTGTATVAQYQAALRSVTYVNTSDNPSTATRTVSFFVFDGSANSNTGTRNISITAVNDAPVITSNLGGATAAVSMAENTTAVTTLTSSDVDGAPPVYSISGGADNARFAIDPNSGVLRFIAAPDFDAPADAGGDNVYNVTVQVSDGSASDTQAIVVTVSDVSGTLVVTTTSDASDGDTSSIEALNASRGADGRISLREAIIAANNSANGGGGADRIAFDITDPLIGGAHTIDLASLLPAITDAVVIDASTEPDWATASVPVVVLNGGGVVADGLRLHGASGGSTLRGLVIQNFSGSGLDITSSGNTIAGNFIGTSASGLAAAGNAIGINLTGGDDNVIGGTAGADRNLISGNSNLGINIGGAADRTRLLNNDIGSNASGSLAAGSGLGNGVFGVFIRDSVGTRIGGIAAGEANRIAHNGGHGVVVFGGAATGHVILGNAIANNGGRGISLGADGSGTGNNAQNTLQLASATTVTTTAGSELRFSGTLGGAAGTHYRVELFANTAGDASGFGEGQTWLGFANVSIGASGVAVVSETLNVAVAPGSVISATVTRSDASYTSFIETSAFANNVLARAPGITVAPQLLAVTDEAGASTPFSVVLDAAPTADVTIAIASSHPREGTASTTLVTFTAANWNIAQTVTVTGVDDGLDDGDRAYAIVLGAASSADTAYHGLNAADVAITNRDDDDRNRVAVTTTADSADGDTSSLAALAAAPGADGRISLREAILAANNTANGSGGADRIVFDIAEALLNGRHTIGVASALPAISDAVFIDATPQVTLDGSAAGAATHGLVLTSSNSLVQGLRITGFGGAGIAVTGAGASGNALLGNLLAGNGGPGIDLGADGVTANDAGDGDAGPNGLQNTPLLASASAAGGNLSVTGTLNSAANTVYRIEFFADNAFVGFTDVTTDGAGNAGFASVFGGSTVAPASLVSATATRQLAGNAHGSTSEFAAPVAANTAPGHGLPGAQTLAEDGTLAIGGLSVADAEGNLASTRASVGHGTLALSLAGGASITAGANGSASLTLAGSLAQVNAALATLVYTADADFNGADTLSLLSTDALGAATASTLAIDISAVNDAPLIAAGATVTLAATDEDTPTAPVSVAALLANGVLGHADADAGALRGLAVISSGGRGRWQYSGDGVAWVDIGSVSVSNALLLDAAAQLRYVPDGLNGESGASAQLGFRAWDASSGSASSNAAPSYADPGAGGGSSAFSVASASLQAGVSAVNDAPTALQLVGAGAPNLAVAENSAAGTLLATAIVTDPDAADSAVYTLTDSAGGRFAIDAATGALRVADATRLDFEAAAMHSVTVRATDAAGQFIERVVGIALGDVNEPIVAVADGAVAVEAGGVANGTPGSHPAGNVLANDRDPDAGDSRSVTGVAAGVGAPAGGVGNVITGRYGSLTLAADGQWQYTLDDGDAAVQALRDAATTLTDTFSYTVRDAAGLEATAQLTITVEGANDAPTLAPPGGLTVAENGRHVSTISASDADAGSSLTFSIAGGADAARFSIDAATGVLRFLSAPDHEAPGDADGDNVYEVTVRSSDGALFDEQALAVAVGNVNEAPDAGPPLNLGLDEDTTVTGNVLQGASDPDRDALTAVLVSGPAHAASFTLAADGSFSYTPAADWFGSDSFSIAVSDGSFTTASLTVTLQVRPVNDAPQLLANSGLTVAENAIGNTITAAMLAVADAEQAAGALVYMLTSAPAHGSLRVAGALLAAGDAFTQADIDAGRLRYDHDGSETRADGFAFSVADGAGGGFAANLAIAVTPVDDNPPQFGSAASVDVVENSRAVVTVQAGDADLPAPTLGYRIAGGADAASFTIDAATGALRFADAPDFEAPTDADRDNVYDVVVEADDGSQPARQRLQVSVVDINEAPQATDLRLAATEDTPLAFSADAVGLRDPDAGDALGRLAVEAIGGAGRFVLAGGAGADATPLAAGQTLGPAELARLLFIPDADASGSAYATLTLRLYDTAGLAAATPGTLTIDVAAVDDAPQISAVALMLQPGAPLLLDAAQFAASDIDSASLTFIVSDMQFGRFEAVANPGVAIERFSQADVASGRVRFVALSSRSMPSFRVAVTDGVQTSAAISATIAFAPVELAPPAGMGLPVMADESAPAEPEAERGSGGERPADPLPAAALPAPRGPMFAVVDAEPLAVGITEPVRSSIAKTAAPERSTRGSDEVVPDLVVELAAADDSAFALLTSGEQASGPSRADDRAAAGTDAVDARDDGAGGLGGATVADAVRAAGAALTAGSVWWALRAGGLIASLLVVLPAWRHVDLLAVLPDDEDEDPWDRVDEAGDDEAARDERAVRRVFEAGREGEPA